MLKAFYILLACAALVLGSIGQSSASSLFKTKTIPNMTPITQEAACRGFGPHCPPGYTRECNRRRCWCRPCW